MYILIQYCNFYQLPPSLETYLLREDAKKLRDSVKDWQRTVSQYFTEVRWWRESCLAKRQTDSPSSRHSSMNCGGSLPRTQAARSCLDFLSLSTRTYTESGMTYESIYLASSTFSWLWSAAHVGSKWCNLLKIWKVRLSAALGGTRVICNTFRNWDYPQLLCSEWCKKKHMCSKQLFMQQTFSNKCYLQQMYSGRGYLLQMCSDSGYPPHTPSFHLQQTFMSTYFHT